MYDNLSRVIEVDIDEILPNRFQPRIQFDEEEILELSDSIKEHGVIQPLVVRTIGDKYEIIAGERRYKASVLAGKETVPVIVKNLNDKDSAEIALIENIQRKNLTPIEEALSYKKILDMGYITQENLASKLGKSQSSVANKIRLLNLSDEVQEALLENKISERHARSLLKLTTSKQQNEMLNRIITERLTVRKADEEIEKMKNDSSDESNDDTQKIIEKGELEMNNNMFGMPNIPQNPQPSFDIFGGSASTEQPAVPEIPSVPAFNPMPEVQPVEQPVPTIELVQTPVMPQAPSFDIFGGSAPVQQQPAVPEIPSVPAFNPMPEVQPVEQPVPPVGPGLPEFVTPTVPEVQTTQPMSMPEMPSMEPAPSIPVIEPSEPQMPTIDIAPSAPIFNPMPEVQTIQQPEMPPMNPSMPEPIVPQTAPIMESPVEDNNQMTQQSENLFSFGDTNINTPEPVVPVQSEVSTVPEFKMPEPIIITDYSKQYDPIMPVTPETMAPTVDFKEVISAIRECSSKIEQYGFRIDVEEYDLANLYQVIFKIEK